jgi:hypothetical protein
MTLDKFIPILNKIAATLGMLMFVIGGGLALFVMVYGN